MTVGSETDPPPRRVRGPSPAKTAATRAAILAAALAEFEVNGLVRTRMSDVATRARVAKGTTYLHFRDKQALFEGVVEAFMVTPLSAMTAGGPQPGEHSAAFLRRVLIPAAAQAGGSPLARVMRIMIADGRHAPALAAAYHRLVVAPGLAQVRALAAMPGAAPQAAVLLRFPHLIFAPVVMGTVWNGLFTGTAPVDLAEMLGAQIDLLFGPRRWTGRPALPKGRRNGLHGETGGTGT